MSEKFHPLNITLGFGLGLALIGYSACFIPMNEVDLKIDDYLYQFKVTETTPSSPHQNKMLMLQPQTISTRGDLAPDRIFDPQWLTSFPVKISLGEVETNIMIEKNPHHRVLAVAQYKEQQNLHRPKTMMNSQPGIKGYAIQRAGNTSISHFHDHTPPDTKPLGIRPLHNYYHVKALGENGDEINRYILTANHQNPKTGSRLILAEVMPASQTLQTSRGLYRYKKMMTMEATAYYPGPECTGKYAIYGRTFTGKKAGYGIAAVDPAVIPLGSKLYVAGYGHAQAEDIGGLIKGNRIDLCFATYREAIHYGRKDVKVYILE